MKAALGLFILCFLSSAYGKETSLKQELIQLNQQIAELQAIESCEPHHPGDCPTYLHLLLDDNKKLLNQLTNKTLFVVDKALQKDQQVVAQLLKIIDEKPVSAESYMKLVQYAVRTLQQAAAARTEFIEFMGELNKLNKNRNELFKLNSLLRLLRDYYQNDSIFYSNLGRFLQIVKRESVVESVPNYDKELGDIMPSTPADGEAMNLEIIRIKFDLELLKKVFGDSKLAAVRIKTKKSWLWNVPLLNKLPNDEVRDDKARRTLDVEYDQTAGCNKEDEDKIICRKFPSEFAMQWHLKSLVNAQ